MAPSRRLGVAALAASLPTALLVATDQTPAAAAPIATTSTATLDVRSEDSGGREVVVTVEPDHGRVEVSPYYWPSDEGGRYLHVGVGTSGDSGCAVTRWVVVDTTDLAATTAYDAAGEPEPPTRSFTVPEEWAEHVARVGIAPFGPVDCVRAASHASPDPAHHGPRIWTGRARALEPIGFADVPGSFPASVTCPRSLPWGEEVDLGIDLLTDPGSYPPAGVVPHPSHLGSLGVTIDPGPFAIDAAPDLPADVDLWTAPSWHGAFTLDPDDDQVFGIHLSGTTTRDGATAAWSCGTVPVSLPAPTGWVGSLVGTTWWRRGTSSNSGIGDFALHRAYEFLDDTWVYVSDEYAGARTEPCTTPAPSWPAGCHRYFYDEESGRLQVDDRRARRTATGYRMPGTGSRAPLYRVDHVVLPARTGQRFAYEGASTVGSLRLRRDGTYRYHGDHPDTGRQVTWAGRYRLVGGDVQQLVLHHGSRTFRDEVQLCFERSGERTVLVDLDTHHRLFRFSRDR